VTVPGEETVVAEGVIATARLALLL